MVYRGSKNKYAKYIIPIINEYIKKHNITTFIDCFCGGANISDKIICDNIIANDLSPSLIALHKQAQEDFNKIPKEGSREYWDAAKKDWKEIQKAVQNNQEIPKTELSLMEIGAIEFYGSFSNGGFPKGYAKATSERNYYKEAYNNHYRQSLNKNYSKIKFINYSYEQIPFTDFDSNSTVLYCDSPYKNVTPYGISPNFNFDSYYNWIREISKKFPIFISEQKLPEDLNKCIWQKENVKRTCGLDNNFKATEKLFFLDNKEEKINEY